MLSLAGTPSNIQRMEGALAERAQSVGVTSWSRLARRCESSEGLPFPGFVNCAIVKKVLRNSCSLAELKIMKIIRLPHRSAGSAGSAGSAETDFAQLRSDATAAITRLLHRSPTKLRRRIRKAVARHLQKI